MIGIRADEPRRVSKIRANPSDGRKGVHRTMPLATDNISKFDVMNFWNDQSFDLKLPNLNGTTYHGNCDLCFLKKPNVLFSLILEKPERANWWIKMEELIENPHIKDGNVFRKDRPKYASMLEYSKSQQNLFDDGEEAIVDFKQSNKPKRREWIEDYKLQLAGYALAHNEVYGTNIQKGVNLICTKDNFYQEFIFDGEEFKKAKYDWLKRVDQYYAQKSK
jgi:hypothetical protein